MTWGSELKVLENRLRSILDQVHTLGAETPRVLLYREVLVRAARLDNMIQSAEQLSVLRDNRSQQRLRNLVDRATSVGLDVIAQNRQLLERSSDDFWPVRDPDGSEEGDRAAATYRGLLDTHANAMLLAFARRRQLPVPPAPRLASSTLQGWLASIDGGERREVRKWVQTFRLARLSFGPGRQRDEGVMNVLSNDIDENAVRRIRQLVESVMGALSPDMARGNLAPQIGRFVEELARRAEEIGFDGLVESLMDGAVPPDVRSWINIVPGDGHGACCPVVVALVRGRKGRCGWSKSLSALRTHLIRCSNATKLALIVTNQWNDESFDQDFAEDLRAFSGKGVKFVVLLGGHSSRGLTQINADL
jgi:hypothetical protein